MASKNSETVLTKLDKDLKLDNLESGKEQSKRSFQNGSVSEVPPSFVKSNEGKPKPPVPPKRSTLTYGKSYVSLADTNAHGANPEFSPTLSLPLSKEFLEEPCQTPTSQLVTVTTNILSTAPKGLPTPKSKNQRVLSTFLPALPPKFCKSPLVQSPNFPRTHNLEFKKVTEADQVLENQKPERRVSEKDSTSPSSVSSNKTQSSSASNSLDRDIPKDDTDSVKSSTENTPSKNKSQKEFSPSQSPPLLLESPPKPPRKSVPETPTKKNSPESSPPSLESSPLPIRKSPSLNQLSEVTKSESKNDLSVNDKDKSTKQCKDDGQKVENIPPQPLYLEDSNENINTIKRAPSSDQKNGDANKDRLKASAVKLRPKSPIRVSFARKDEADAKFYEKLSRTKRATKELKNIIHQIEYSESDYCSDDNCRTCVVQKTSSLSRRRSASPKTAFSKSIDLLEGYTSCCEEGTKTISKKTKSLTRKIDKKSGATYNRVLCNCPLDNLVIDNRIPLSRPNSSIGDYCTQPTRSRSAVRAKKNSGAGIKTPFLSGSSKVNFDRPGLGLIVTISSDGIDKEPKRTVQFISGGPAINFGLGGTLGRYTKSKSQDKCLKISETSFNVDHIPADLEDVKEWAKNSAKPKNEKEEAKKSQTNVETTQEIINAQKHNDNNVRPIPVLERQKSAGELRRPQTCRAAEEYRQRYLNSLSKKKSPGEVLEHFGKLATSVTTSEISKITDNKKVEGSGGDLVKGHIKTFEKISKAGGSQSHSFENYRTVPPTSFNHPDSYLGSAFVQYVRETLPYQPNSFPGGTTGSAFNKYIRPGSGRFDKSLIFPQQPKSDKPSAFERLCGDKIYASRRGVYGKVPPQNQNVSGSLDCVWGKPKPAEPPKVNESDDETAGKEIRPASCTYEINKGRLAGGPSSSSGPYSNYSVVVPAYNKEEAASEIPRTSKKGIIESETSTTQVQPPMQIGNSKLSSQAVHKPSNPPQYFNPRSLENYKLAPGFKTDLSTLYSGVFYTNPKQDSASSKLSNSSRILYEYGIKYLGTSNRGAKEETGNEGNTESMGTSTSTARGSSSDAGTGRKMLTGGLTAMTTAARIPEEATVGTTVIYPPQYHPTEKDLMQENQQVIISI